MSEPLYVYLCYGRSPAAERELRYSLETLQAELAKFPSSHTEHGPSPLAGEGGRRPDEGAPSASRPAPTLTLPHKGGGNAAVLYTDRVEAFPDLDINLIDAAPLLREARARNYTHRIKPLVIADALRRFGRPVVLMDLDSFIRPGFPQAVAHALAEGAAMNQFVRPDAYPDFPTFETNLPHLGRYRLDHAKSAMFNSGLVAVTPAHLPLIENALALIDALWSAKFHRHDVEQFAISEALRLGGAKIALIDGPFEHYCARWARRYMRRRLRRRAPGERIPYGKTRIRLFKAAWTLRLAMRKARRFMKDRIWRRT